MPNGSPQVRRGAAGAGAYNMDTRVPAMQGRFRSILQPRIAPGPDGQQQGDSSSTGKESGIASGWRLPCGRSARAGRLPSIPRCGRQCVPAWLSPVLLACRHLVAVGRCASRRAFPKRYTVPSVFEQESENLREQTHNHSALALPCSFPRIGRTFAMHSPQLLTHGGNLSNFNSSFRLTFAVPLLAFEHGVIPDYNTQSR
jgi:hypothetical protein